MLLPLKRIDMQSIEVNKSTTKSSKNQNLEKNKENWNLLVDVKNWNLAKQSAKDVRNMLTLSDQVKKI